ncbi:cell wall-binding repeat-containing protein [Candidatus Poriferisodalis sp.]|uniref:cell wall-binding repeat-containing protein n=1 Tax=Candidatus Poriferisodalis sp. TaxID=3101277 RepID=UPI003B01C649
MLLGRARLWVLSGRRRAAVVLLAAAVAGSMLAVAPGAGVGAANSAGEFLVDTNRDGRPDSRAFAGGDRYATALLLAEHFADDGTPGTVDAVIVASGASLVDAVAAAGLAGYEQAPVLLTRPDGLPRGVAEFVEDQGVRTVYVAGGTAAVSERVVTQLEGLASSPKVTRVAGADRYATAAAMAKLTRSSARWCGTNDDAVLLANGDAAPWSAAVAAGPLAYALEMPLLLTPSDALAAAAAEYIDDNGIDRVVIVGGTDQVSAAVADQVTALGARTERVAGADAAATSVAVARLMWGACAGVGTDTNRVALVSATSAADGVAAAPVLGAGIGGSGKPVPALLVGEVLPVSVRDWLAATPVADAAGARQHLWIAAVGGTAAVPASVMAAAVAAASGGAPLTAKISRDPLTRDGRIVGNLSAEDRAKQEEEDRQFTITFSDKISQTPAARTTTTTFDAWFDRLASMLYLNGAPMAVAADGIEADTNYPPSGTCGAGTRVTVTSSDTLKAGDRIELRPNESGSMLGVTGDMRRVQPASFTVPLKTTVPVVPVVELVAVEGENSAAVRVAQLSDSELTRPNDVNSASHAADYHPVSVVSKAGAKIKTRFSFGDATLQTAAANNQINGYKVVWKLAEAFDMNGDGDTGDSYEAKGSSYALQAGDVVTIDRGAFVHTESGAQSRYTRTVVTKRIPKFGATSVQIGKTDTGVNDDPADDDLTGGLPADEQWGSDADLSRRAIGYLGPKSGDHLKIRARWDGIAAGARGNDWSVNVRRPAGASGSGFHRPDDPVDIDVRVVPGIGAAGGGRIDVTVLAGTPTLGDMHTAVTGTKAFADSFTAEYSNCARRGRKLAAVPEWLSSRYKMRGGVTTVGILVTWEDFVHTVLTNTLTCQVLGALVPGHYTGGSPVSCTAGAFSSARITARTVVTTDAGWAATPPEPAERSVYSASVEFLRPSKSARIQFSTTDISKLPTLTSGSGRGVVTFYGSFYEYAPDGTRGQFDTDSGSHVAGNYLLSTYSWSGRVPEIDDDGDGDATYGKGPRTEPVDFHNRAQKIAVTTGNVPSTPYGY